MIFFPRDDARREKLKKLIKYVCESNELNFLGWREVPVDSTVLGPNASKTAPSIWQFFVKSPARLPKELDGSQDGFERTLYLVRRRFEVERKLKGLSWDDDDNEVM
jgi:glutamate synthase (ferredoxin)